MNASVVFFLDALIPEDALQWFQGAAAGKATSTANGYLRVFKVLMADAAAQYRLAAGCGRAASAIPPPRRQRVGVSIKGRPQPRKKAAGISLIPPPFLWALKGLNLRLPPCERGGVG